VAASVTGVAGPGGGTPTKPVGLVHLHVAAPDADEAVRLDVPGDRERIRGRATASLLQLRRGVLTRTGDTSG
jgi:nicotinamide mononucleotide (NMN) deamidase PncC